MPEQLQAILEKIKAYQTIIIHRHISPDPDALGSQVGLAEILRNSFPEKQIYQVGTDIGTLSWLAQMQEVSDELYQNALVITTDAANTPRISDQRYNQGDYLIKIDHHPNDDPYGQINWVQTQASSCSEIIYDFVTASKGQLKINQAAARLLYAGIVGDTGRFMYDNTSVHTMTVAADLMRYDIKPTEIVNQMNIITLAQAKLQGYALENLTLVDEHVATLMISQKLLKELALDQEFVHVVIGTAGRIAGILSWVTFVEQTDGHYKVHFRSKGPIINEIAKRHDGGGHPLASGAKAADLTEVKQIIQEVQTVVQASLS